MIVTFICALGASVPLTSPRELVLLRPDPASGCCKGCALAGETLGIIPKALSALCIGVEVKAQLHPYLQYLSVAYVLILGNVVPESQSWWLGFFLCFRVLHQCSCFLKSPQSFLPFLTFIHASQATVVTWFISFPKTNSNPRVKPAVNGKATGLGLNIIAKINGTIFGKSMIN